MLIAAVASRTHAIVELRKICAAAGCTTAVRRRLILEYGAYKRRRGTLPAWQALRLAWAAAPALALPTLFAGSRGRRDDVAR
eukprot:288286-Pleurochrysis_carterae.AAC.1